MQNSLVFVVYTHVLTEARRAQDEMRLIEERRAIAATREAA